MSWLDTVMNGSELVRSKAMSALNQLKLALSCALGEATEHLQKLETPTETDRNGPKRPPIVRSGSDVKRLGACASFLTSELRELEAGRPMMGKRYGQLLSSTIRQQLRTVVDNCPERVAALLRQLPRGRGLGYLGNVNSAAKVRSSRPLCTRHVSTTHRSTLRLCTSLIPHAVNTAGALERALRDALLRVCRARAGTRRPAEARPA